MILMIVFEKVDFFTYLQKINILSLKVLRHFKLQNII